MNNIKYVGMDVHKRVIVIAVINEQGQVESLTKIKTKAENFRDYFSGLSGTVHVVFEEGGWSAWLYKLLKPLVSSVTVCETRHNKLIGAGNKSDEEDAEILARLLRLGELNQREKRGAICPIALPQKAEIVVPGQRFMQAAKLDQRLGLMIEDRSQGRVLLSGWRLLHPDREDLEKGPDKLIGLRLPLKQRLLEFFM